jgi:hypothetical protein
MIFQWDVSLIDLTEPGRLAERGFSVVAGARSGGVGERVK